MLKEQCRVLGRTEIRSGIGTANLAHRVLKIAFEVHAGTHLVHELDVFRRLDNAAPARNQQAALALKRTKRRGLELAEALLALGLKDLGHRLAATADHQAVGIDKPALEHVADITRERRFARAQKADKEDVVAAMFDVLGHNETYSSQGSFRSTHRCTADPQSVQPR